MFNKLELKSCTTYKIKFFSVKSQNIDLQVNTPQRNSTHTTLISSHLKFHSTDALLV